MRRSARPRGAERDGEEMTAAEAVARSPRSGKSAVQIQQRLLIGLALVTIGLTGLLNSAAGPGALSGCGFSRYGSGNGAVRDAFSPDEKRAGGARRLRKAPARLRPERGPDGRARALLRATSEERPSTSRPRRRSSHSAKKAPARPGASFSVSPSWARIRGRGSRGSSSGRARSTTSSGATRRSGAPTFPLTGRSSTATSGRAWTWSSAATRAGSSTSSSSARARTSRTSSSLPRRGPALRR